MNLSELDQDFKQGIFDSLLPKDLTDAQEK